MIRAIHDVKGIDIGNSLVRYKAEMDFDGRELTRSYLDKQDLNELLKVSSNKGALCQSCNKRNALKLALVDFRTKLYIAMHFFLLYLLARTVKLVRFFSNQLIFIFHYIL